jgi:glycosyltransferase involved in cell wall biosynthesis
VPCKYFDALPEEGIDICFIDTAHFNPGEHLNILEVLPFMKKNGIVIYHDTSYHSMFGADGTTCHISINTLNGKRLFLKSEQTMSLPNIGAIILDDNIDDMLFPLFSNLSLPWSYKITEDDFVEMFKYFSKYYSSALLRIYVYYCYFYMNGGVQNKELAGRIAEKESMILQGELPFIKNVNSSKNPIVAMVNSDSGNGEQSETFVKLQKEKINAKVNYYNGGIPPNCINGISLATPYFIAFSEVCRQDGIFNLMELEIPVAVSFINENTDVVFAQFGHVGVGIMNVCKQLNIPLIIHFHGFDISIKTVIENFKEKYREMFEYATYIIAVSQYMKSTLTNLGCPQEKIIYNPCAANDEYYNIQPTFKNKLFVGAGRFVQKKAPQNTIIAFKKVLEKHPDAKLILAGNGELLNFCRNLVEQNHLKESVCLPGIFKSEQLKQWLSEAMAFVQHSITAPNGDMEGTPVVICEASLAGLPVVSTFHAGIPDVIIDGKTGLLVEEGDIDEMAQNMVWILDNPEKAKEMGLAGKKNIRENFSMEKHIGKLDEIIYEIVRRKGERNYKRAK